jgi:ribose transport system ATP-binding protein
MSPSAALLEVRGVRKTYSASVLALAGVDFDLRAGEVHALVGGNGAGKSTLSRVVAGVTAPDAGTMALRGQPFAPASRTAAEHEGVRMVMQELNLVPTLTIAESIFLNRLPRRFGLVDYRSLHADARPVMARVGLGDLEPDRSVGSLGIGQQQLVEIAAGLSRRCDVLILDEPTAALTGPEAERLFAQIAQLRAEGAGVIYISHRLEEIRRVADRITVLRDGAVVATRDARETTADEVVRLMVGRDLRHDHARRGAGGEVALRVEDLRRGDAVAGVSFELRRGEILGLAGLMGSGRTETLRAIFGADRPEGGRVYLHGSDRPAVIRGPRDAVRLGMALLTEDRKGQGLLLPLPVRANVTLSRLGGVARLGLLDRAEEAAAAGGLMRTLAIRASSVEQPVAELSGGNQQKVVLGKWLYTDPDILLFDEPTRGIDVGAKFEIYRLLLDLADKGKAILVVSSELEELTGLCDRIAVMSAGRVAAVFGRGEWTEEKIMAASLSNYAGGAV